jgi:hypothetical protein
MQKRGVFGSHVPSANSMMGIAGFFPDNRRYCVNMDDITYRMEISTKEVIITYQERVAR